MGRYTVKYYRAGSNSLTSTIVSASSESDAKEQIKARYVGARVVSAHKN